jgi:hypothetical protein
VPAFLEECWQTRSLNDFTILQCNHEWSAFGDHHRLTRLTERKQSNHTMLISSVCVLLTHLLLFFLSKDEWIKTCYRDILSPGSDEISQQFMRKIIESLVFSKPRKFSNKNNNVWSLCWHYLQIRSH